jgi:hypothetical protein
MSRSESDRSQFQLKRHRPRCIADWVNLTIVLKVEIRNGMNAGTAGK